MVPFLKNVRTIPIFLVNLYFSVLEYSILYRILFLFENLKINNFLIYIFFYKRTVPSKECPPTGVVGGCTV
jgi:hypothetical protein